LGNGCTQLRTELVEVPTFKMPSAQMSCVGVKFAESFAMPRAFVVPLASSLYFALPKAQSNAEAERQRKILTGTFFTIALPLTVFMVTVVAAGVIAGVKPCPDIPGAPGFPEHAVKAQTAAANSAR